MKNNTKHIIFKNFIKYLYKKKIKYCVLTIGNFDGLHLAHQELLKQTSMKASSLALVSVVILFEPQPQEFFNNNTLPSRLMSLAQKLTAISKLIIDYVVIVRFNKELAKLTKQDFVDNILLDQLHVQHVVVGHDFRFGYKREGDVNFLRAYGSDNGFGVTQVLAIKEGSDIISSSLLRNLLFRADFMVVEKILGHAYSISGKVFAQKVVKNQNIKIKIALKRKKAPLSGVFSISILGHSGVAFITGIEQFPDNNFLFVELSQLKENLVGKRVEVTFHKKIRELNLVEDLKMGY